MAGWAEMTSSSDFRLATVDESHMGAISSKELLPMLAEAWRPTLYQGKKEDNLAD
jgi:hypothetical protein